MSKIRLLLYPFGIIYDGVTQIKNFLYNRDIIKSHSFEIPLIIIGNLSVGGTGKTPHTEYVASLLKKTKKVAVLSRGYGRKTTGYIFADETATSETIGDEPKQIFDTVKDINVAVCEDRTTGVINLLKTVNPEVVILDDAFQHRKILGSHYILLTPYQNMFYSDFVMPTGTLRESSSNKNRAHTIIVTKCPSTITEQERLSIIEKISPKAQQNIYFSYIKYQAPIGFDSSHIWQSNISVVLVTGIVNPKPLQNHLEQQGCDVELMQFKDHHHYTENDLSRIYATLKSMNENAVLCTTSKDAVKLKPLLLAFNKKIITFEFPIQIGFLFNQENEFQKNIIAHANTI